MERRRKVVLGALVSLMLAGCSTTADNQLKESPCKLCGSHKEFYRNGLWLEEQERD